MEKNVVMNNIQIQGRDFDYSPTLKAYVHKATDTLTLVFDGTNVVPLQVYELSRTRTVGPDGAVSQTDTLRFVQQHEQAQQEYAVALVALKTQLAKVGVSLAAGLGLVALVCAGMIGWAFARAISAHAADIMTGPALALTELFYLLTWVVGGALSLTALYFITRYLIGLFTGTGESAAPDLQVRHTPADPPAQAVNININQAGSYNAAQQYAQHGKV